MFIVYRIQTLELKTVNNPGIICPLCKNKGGIQLGVFQRYIWFVRPLFPLYKLGLAACTTCGQKIPNNQWPNELEQQYTAVKASSKTPPRLWYGLITVPLIFAACMAVITGGVYFAAKYSRHLDENNAAKAKEYITHPQKGDLYKVMVPDDKGQQEFTYVRFVNISGDTLFVQKLSLPNYDYNKWEDLKTDNFETRKIPVDLKYFQQQQDLAVLSGKDVLRPVVFVFSALKRNDTFYKKYQ